MLRLLDTATRSVSELVPGSDGRIGLYVCGPTVYGPPHVGHGRFALVYDVLRRYLEHRGLSVHHVSNVTDVDDKIIQRAIDEHRHPKEVAEEAERQWWDAMTLLGVAEPHDRPHATDYVPQMAALVAELVAAGAAYPSDDGVYLSVAAVPGYGLLPHQDPEELRAGARVEAGGHKRAPADFAVWKAARPGEPSWESPFGPGRPGWHSECVVMSLALLGDGFSLHGGGQDLIFPHHENERAQAVAIGHGFARHWMHNGMVVVAGEKMSKSVGNVLDLGELLAAGAGRAYRMLVLRSQYRSPLEVVEDVLEDAARQVERVDALARRLAALPPGEPAPDQIAAVVTGLRDDFYAAMDDDLDTPGALAGLFEGLRRANTLLDDGDVAAGSALGQAALDLLGALGLHAVGEEPVPAEVSGLVTRRDAARNERHWAAADELKAEIERHGWQVEDAPAGTRVRRRPGSG